MRLEIDKYKLKVGYGTNNFSMTKGSFKYKQSFDWKTECKLVSSETKGSQQELLFEDKKYGGLYRLTVNTDDGKTVIKMEPLSAQANDKANRFWLTIPSHSKEHFYGCGETYSEFDLKGEKVRIWVAEHQNGSRISKKVIKESIFGKHPESKLKFQKYESYYAQPTFTSSDRYYLHVDTNKYCEFDFTEQDSITIYTQEPMKIISEKAESFSELSFKLSNLLGRQTKLPDWVYEGAIIASQDWVRDGENVKEGFAGCENIDRKLEKLEKAGAKIVGVWSQDWCGCRCTGFGYQVMWNWSYSKEQYGNLPEKITEWKKKGVHFLGYINPFLALEKEIYKQAHELGYCVKDKNGDDYLVTITTFPAAMIDLTNPKAYEWYKDLIKKNMIVIGMSGWMADFGEYLPVDAVLFEGDPEELHNQWPAIWAKLNREAIEETGKEDEVFFFTRAGHTNTIRYSTMMWTGDQHVDWSIDDGLPSVIPATLSLAMSGFGMAHSDVGGYTTIKNIRRSKELLLRWEEMNIFSPIYRFHEGNRPGYNVQACDDEELIKHLEFCSNTHSKLAPYLKELVSENQKKGTPVMRPIFYHYDEDWAYEDSSEYLLGRDILVAPVLTEKAISREVILPEDKWIHLFTGEEYEGGKFTIDAPIGKPPVFIRKESKQLNELLGIIK